MKTIVTIDELCENAIILDGFDEAVLGLVSSFEGPRVLYDLKKILEILQADGMKYSEALEYFNFNILSAHMGEQNPVFLDVELKHHSKNQYDLRWSCYFE